jgi:hypothetical protein
MQDIVALANQTVELAIRREIEPRSRPERDDIYREVLDIGIEFSRTVVVETRDHHLSWSFLMNPFRDF